MARTSGSLAKRTPGTRILPRGSIAHSCSDRRVRSERSTDFLLDVHHALHDPGPVRLACHAEGGHGCALDLDRGLVTLHHHRLPEPSRPQPLALDLHLVAREEHITGGHLEDDGV